MKTQPKSASRLELPPAGGAVFLTVVCTIIVFFVGVAIFNLWRSDSLTTFEIVASVLWLCLAGMWLVGGIVETGGIRRALVNCLGMFSRRAFIETCRPGDGPVMLRFGFGCLGREFDYANIELARIGMVSWNAGQASGRSGRDQDDWSVAVWFWKPGRTGPWDRRKVKDHDLILITPSLPKEDAAAAGRSVIELLNDAGVQLASDEENSFIVTA